MISHVTKLVLAAVLGFAMTVPVAAADAPEAVVGSWTPNLARSRFSPGPAPRPQTRSYAATGVPYDNVMVFDRKQSRPSRPPCR